MDLTNLTKGQKLYSALNGEVTFVCYINNRDKVPYLICTEKNNHLFYYLINGKVDNAGIIVLFTQPLLHSSNVNVILETEEQAERITKDIIEDIINMYENVIECPNIDCTNREQVIEEVWQRMQ